MIYRKNTSHFPSISEYQIFTFKVNEDKVSPDLNPMNLYYYHATKKKKFLEEVEVKPKLLGSPGEQRKGV